jgi:hypothetical protein
VRRRTIIALALALSCAATATAQDAPAFRPRQVIVSGGTALTSGYPIGDLTVTIPRNAAGTPPPFTLLQAQSEISRTTGVDLRVAVALTRSFAIEAGAAYARPELGVTVSQDPELTAGAFASERISQYVIDVSGIYQLPIALGRRARPYAIGGGGYVRQLHEGRVMVETGNTLHLGAGVHYWLRGMSGNGRAFGVRGEARFVRRTGAVKFEERARSFAGLSALAFLSF